MKLFRSIAIGALVPLALALSLQVHVEPDQNNIVAGRLAGVWRSDPLVSTRLGLEGTQVTVEFLAEDRFMESIPDAVADQLATQRIFESGLMVTREQGKLISSEPYFLTSRSGNPYLLKLHEEDGVPLAGIESTRVFVAPGEQRLQDLLLLEWDDKSKALKPFRRVSQ